MSALWDTTILPREHSDPGTEQDHNGPEGPVGLCELLFNWRSDRLQVGAGFYEEYENANGCFYFRNCL